MKATRKNIPTLIQRREPFANGSDTLKGIVRPTKQSIRRLIIAGKLTEHEATTLQADTEDGISYLIVSYETPIGWETDTGKVHIVRQALTQTSDRHRDMLSLFKGE